MIFSHPLPTRRWLKSFWGMALVCTLWTAGLARAQAPSSYRVLLGLELMNGSSATDNPSATENPQSQPAPQFSPPPAFIPSDEGSITDTNLKKASCPSCGLGNSAASYGPGPAGCIPGRTHCCTWCNYDTLCGRCFGGFYDALCCPDPCYEPSWIPEANAAFFQDSPRPVTQTRIRWDAGLNYRFPDTAEFFWAQTNGGKGPKNLESRVNYNELTLYQEVAAKGASFFVELPYLTVDPANNPSAVGMGDMNLGTKSVLFDRELLLLTFQFKTILLTGNPSTGTGTGHVSLEPSFMGALKLTSSTFLQGQLAYCIPISGSPGVAGSVLEYHASLNQTLCQREDCFKLIATMEMNGFSYQGTYTDATGLVTNGGSSFFNAGPGLRISFCNRCDLGFGCGFGFGYEHGPEQIYRTEFRVRF